MYEERHKNNNCKFNKCINCTMVNNKTYNYNKDLFAQINSDNFRNILLKIKEININCEECISTFDLLINQNCIISEILLMKICKNCICKTQIYYSSSNNYIYCSNNNCTEIIITEDYRRFKNIYCLKCNKSDDHNKYIQISNFYILDKIKQYKNGKHSWRKNNYEFDHYKCTCII